MKKKCGSDCGLSQDATITNLARCPLDPNNCKHYTGLNVARDEMLDISSDLIRLLFRLAAFEEKNDLREVAKYKVKTAYKLLNMAHDEVASSLKHMLPEE